jgi:hypothetical protein
MDQVDDEQTVHWSIRSVTAGREVVRADRLYLPLNPQALGKPPCCGPVKVPVAGAAVRGPEARNAERARSTPPAARPAPTRCHSGEALRARADVAPHACRAARRRASASRLDRDQAVEQRAPASFSITTFRCGVGFASEDRRHQCPTGNSRLEMPEVSA